MNALAFLLAGEDAALEERTQAIGRELFARTRHAHGATPWRRFEERVVGHVMRDAELQARLFRLVDVLPALESGEAVVAHLRDDLLEYPALPRAFARVLEPNRLSPLIEPLVGSLVRAGVTWMGHRFIAGEDIDAAVRTAHRLRRRGAATTIDMLGEAVTSEEQADRYAATYLELIDRLADAAHGWTPVVTLDRGTNGPLPRTGVSLKLSSLDARFDALAWQRSTDRVLHRLRPILRRARDREVAVCVDMEQYAHKGLILHIFRSALLEPGLRDFEHAGVVIQAYLKDADRDLRGLLDWARRRGTPVSVRLVKGAYWDWELAEAARNGWPVPVFVDKHRTDACFERLTGLLLANREVLRPAIASHNVRSLAHTLALAERFAAAPEEFELQVLYGMAEEVRAALIERGVRVTVYAPCGPLVPGMGYLIRRLLENTSNQGFLRQSFFEQAPIEELLAPPADAELDAAGPPALASPQRGKEMTPAPMFGAAGSFPHTPGPPLPKNGRGGSSQRGGPAASFRAESEVVMNEVFTNEAPSDFSIAANRTAMAQAIDAVRERCGRSEPLVIDGRTLETEHKLTSHDPSHPSFVVGHTAQAGRREADLAVAAAARHWPAWRDTAVNERAGCLRRLAAVMRRERFELAAWIVVEAGKPWRDADAEVAEAIDYCELYAREMLRLAERARRRDLPGERNFVVYEPRGVAAVVAPWNFPLAILAGMTVAALVTGNTVILKPAEQTPVIGKRFFDLLIEAGVPHGVANFLPGLGEEVGAQLVEHPDVALIAFTGSRQVGLGILAAAARMRPGQRLIKRVVAELGGKNAIILDDDADLDEAAAGVAQSAFGYAGQKCSACSRVIVLEAIHDVFLERLVEATKSLKIAPAEDPACRIGPVISAEARERIGLFIDKGKREARLAFAGDLGFLKNEGHYVAPHIFADVPPSSVIAQEEIFGPVLAVLKARNLDEALAIANGTQYALTGGLFSRSPENIQRVKREFRVGNLYINRKITGALVARQPFGGFKLSGKGAKAGGPDYLLNFMLPRVITENTMRRGFAPVTD